MIVLIFLKIRHSIPIFQIKTSDCRLSLSLLFTNANDFQSLGNNYYSIDSNYVRSIARRRYTSDRYTS